MQRLKSTICIRIFSIKSASFRQKHWESPAGWPFSNASVCPCGSRYSSFKWYVAFFGFTFVKFTSNICEHSNFIFISKKWLPISDFPKIFRFSENFPIFRSPDKSSKEHEERKSSNFFVNVLIEISLIFLSGPATQLPFLTKERFFMTTLLLASIIISGTFQVNHNTHSHWRNDKIC